MSTTVTVTHLEMLSRTALRQKATDRTDVAIVRVTIPMPELNRFFYTAVGGAWYWIDRLRWSHSDWLKYLDRPELQTWMVTVAGMPAGYFELESQKGESVEIVYFGMLPQFVGLQLGGWALTRAVETAWEMNAKRVWVHTCTLDHPRALGNYLARGFQIFKTETEIEQLPPFPTGPWPGAW